MITKEQCRAARSFLGLKQADLASMCDLSKTSITHFESGLFQPRVDNMAAIQSALESLGIQFIGQTGVQKRETMSKILEGDTMYTDLWDDIFETLKNKGGEVCIAYFTERDSYNKHPNELKAHIERLEQANITERLIVCEGDSFFVQKQECYRWLPYSVYKAGTTFFTYGNKVAMQFWTGEITMVVSNPDIVKQEKARFDYLWQLARLPDGLLT